MQREGRRISTEEYLNSSLSSIFVWVTGDCIMDLIVLVIQKSHNCHVISGVESHKWYKYLWNTQLRNTLNQDSILSYVKANKLSDGDL